MVISSKYTKSASNDCRDLISSSNGEKGTKKLMYMSGSNFGTTGQPLPTDLGVIWTGRGRGKDQADEKSVHEFRNKFAKELLR